MLRLKPHLLVFLSGLPLFGVGFVLIKKGLTFIGQAAHLAAFLPSQSFPLVNSLSYVWNNENAITLMIVAFGLIAGLFKGRKVIVPSVQRNLWRLQTLSSDAPLTALYDRKGWIILAAMMSLGIVLNILSLPADLRGFIDLTVGVALLQGAMASLRTFASLKKAI